MAEFSKQWCDINDPDMPWDFDLDEEFDRLQPGEFTSLICEGFGFIGIQKQLDGSKYCLYRSGKGIKEAPFESINSR